MSFEYLIEKISLPLKKITKRLNGRFSSFDDEDLFQETLLHLWTEWEKGNLDNKTESYILQGCYFHLKNHLRKTQNKVNLMSFDEPIDENGNSLEEILPSNLPSPSEYLENELLIEEIGKKLSRREKEILALFLKGMTTREVGKKLGISHVMVVKLKGRIRSKCKKGFE